MPAALTDVMDALAGIKPGSALDAVRNRRPQAREQARPAFARFLSRSLLQGSAPPNASRWPCSSPVCMAMR